MILNLRIALSTGQTLAVDRYGAASAEPVVLLHGLSANRHVYDHLATDLKQGLNSGALQLINVDLRGHGESSHATKDAYDAKSYAADIAALVADLVDHRPVRVLAESLGGVIGIALAHDRPDLVKGLFLEDPPLFLGERTRLADSPVAGDFPETIAAVSALQSRGAPLSDYADLMEGVAEPDEIAVLATGLPAWDPMSMQAAMEGILWRDFEPRRRVDAPLTVVRADPEVGAAFEETDVDLLQDANPHARIVLASGASHSVRSSAPQVFAKELARFLEIP
jgi:pimeloyl-ACP methyl ester carboxylesterase